MEETAFPRGGQKRRLEDVKKPKTKELKHYNENLFNV